MQDWVKDKDGNYVRPPVKKQTAPKGFAAPREFQGPPVPPIESRQDFLDKIKPGEFQGPPDRAPVARQSFLDKVAKPRPQSQYDEPIGPDLPEAAKPIVDKVKPNPTYDAPIGPQEPVEGHWGHLIEEGIHPDIGDLRKKLNIQGPSPDFLKGELQDHPKLPKVKSFISDVGDLLTKYGVPAEVLEHAAPIVGKLSKYVLGPAAVGLTGYDISQNPANPEDESDRAAAFQSGKMFPKGMIPPPGGSTGRAMRDLKAGPTASQSPQDEPKSSEPSAGSQNSPAPFLEAPSSTRDGGIQRDTPQGISQTDQPHMPGSDNHKQFQAAISHIQQNHPSKAPLSDEEIVAWNAQHNPGFKQDSGTASFQPSQGSKQSDGILFVGGNVYMSDPRAPDGYKLVHSYGQ